VKRNVDDEAVPETDRFCEAVGSPGAHNMRNIYRILFDFHLWEAVFKWIPWFGLEWINLE